MDGRKLYKKIQRKQHLLKESLPDWDLEFSDDPTNVLLVCNGGILNGVGRELLAAMLRAEDISLPRDQEFSVITCPRVEDSIEIVRAYNGRCIQTLVGEQGLERLIPQEILQGPPLHLLMMYLMAIPPPAIVDDDTVVALPPGCHLLPNFVTEEEETKLIEYFSTTDTCATTSDTSTTISDTCTTTSDTCTTTSDTCTTTISDTCTALSDTISDTSTGTISSVTDLKLRKVHHYGYEFLYGTNSVNPECPLVGGIPEVCKSILERVKATRLVEHEFDQLTVNEYRPGAGEFTYTQVTNDDGIFCPLFF